MGAVFHFFTWEQSKYVLDMIYQLLKPGGVLFGHSVAFENRIERDGKVVENSRGHTLVLRNETKWIDLFRLCGFDDIFTKLLNADEVQTRLLGRTNTNRNADANNNTTTITTTTTDTTTATTDTTQGQYPEWQRRAKAGVGLLVFSVQKKKKKMTVQKKVNIKKKVY